MPYYSGPARPRPVPWSGHEPARLTGYLARPDTGFSGISRALIGAAPVDEVVPMLFRMGRAGENLKRRLAEDGDFADRNCHTSIGVAVDTPPYGLPPSLTEDQPAFLGTERGRAALVESLA